MLAQIIRDGKCTNEDWSCVSTTNGSQKFSYSQCYKDCPEDFKCYAKECCDNEESIKLKVLPEYHYTLASSAYEEEILLSDVFDASMIDTCVLKGDYHIDILVSDGNYLSLPNQYLRGGTKTDDTGVVSLALIIIIDLFVGEWSESCLRLEISHNDFASTKQSNCIIIEVACPSYGGFIAS